MMQGVIFCGNILPEGGAEGGFVEGTGHGRNCSTNSKTAICAALRDTIVNLQTGNIAIEQNAARATRPEGT